MNLSKEEENAFFLKNQNLVHTIIQKNDFKIDGYDYNDIVQVGNIGLLKAIRAFDESKDIQFSSYAWKCITIKILETMRSVKRKSDFCISLYKLVDNVDNIQLVDTLEDPNSSDIFDLIEFKVEIERRLNEHDIEILNLRYKGYTQSYIAETLHVSLSTISSVLKKVRRIIDECRE